MKQWQWLSALACTVFGSAGTVLAQPQVGEFTPAQLGSGGCGMTLWKPNRQDKARFVLFNGLDKNSMVMMLDGKMTKFRRFKASGREFYGQKTSQTFISLDGKTLVEVSVKLGRKGEIESIAIPEGSIQIRRSGKEVKFPVVGDAGC